MENELHKVVIEYLCDPGNQEKRAAAEAWMKGSPERVAQYEAAQAVWDAGATLPPDAFDKSSGWEVLRHELQLPQTGTPVRKIKPRHTWWKVAAVAIPLLALAAYFHNMQHHEEAYTTYRNTGPVNTIDTLQLSDGSQVFLRPGASLRYNMNGPSRDIILLDGEAFFRVAKDEQHPFKLRVAGGLVRVLGTSFNVKKTNAYSDVTVLDGKVSVAHDAAPPVMLTAGQQAVIKDDQVTLQPGNYAYRCGWSNHDLHFNDQPVATVLQTLGDYYHVSLALHDSTLLRKRITIRFNNVPLSEALPVMGEMLDRHASQVSDTQYIFTNK
ncbi:hypothetical protein DCC81_19165 [Chitinophaga parva]|uniref:Uncharacterized protein n=1 Tax=Chitinophaga parva TaxID=2169414 RepID=A0A2T7BJB3_9BACT|nr:FecR domain-containing protein [Chitinophaga parva]PUZ26342.1 hypothetical protein DCC81_19165 [Chitinophaga parva]